MLCLKDCRDQQNIQELTIPEECGYKNIKKMSLRVGYMLLMISNLQQDLIYISIFPTKVFEKILSDACYRIIWRISKVGIVQISP